MERHRIGFTCGYTPVPLIEAAGFTPYRIFPESTAPDQAGHLLHDNLCPHVKRVLDRALAEDLPRLDGMVFMNSCDAMRRLADAWHYARKDDRMILLDLPNVNTASAVAFLADEYRRMAKGLAQWKGNEISDQALDSALDNWNRLHALFLEIETRKADDFYPGLAARVQQVVNIAATQGTKPALDEAQSLLQAWPFQKKHEQVPVCLFGNLLFDPRVYDHFEAWNLQVAGNDFCTGSRFVYPVDPATGKDRFEAMAQAAMRRTSCARTMDPFNPGNIAETLVKNVKQSGARGVIGFTLKFCDPYLARIPVIREMLQNESIPFLMLEGDCTLGAIGQQQTRIEAFTEMLEV